MVEPARSRVHNPGVEEVASTSLVKVPRRSRQLSKWWRHIEQAPGNEALDIAFTLPCAVHSEQSSTQYI